MADILFIKTSSLGDVIHHMPALTEARRHRPDARFFWLVEEAFAPLVRLHPAVNAVIPVAWRRWRKSLLSPATLREVTENLAGIRAHEYDTIIDSQGLLRSAVIARIARGQRHGYDSGSIRERMAVPFYQVRHGVSRGLHAIDRNRNLTARALGYAASGAPDYGLDRARFANAKQRYAVLQHGTARPEKEWPQVRWIELGQTLAARGFDLVLPWGTDAERQRSEMFAASLPRAKVGERQPLDKVAQLIAGASLVVGVDTGLLHLAAAFGVPLVAIFAGSNPALTGPVGAGPIEVLGSAGAPPSAADVAVAAERIAG